MNIIFIVFFLCVQGCGRSAEISSMQQSSDGDLDQKKPLVDRDLPAKFFQVRWAMEDVKNVTPQMPDLSFLEKDQNLDFTVDDTQIIIHKKFYLPDLESLDLEKKREHYFLWTDHYRDNKIVSAVYTHRVVTRQGPVLGDLQSYLVWHDVERRIWFIPISEIFNHGDYGGSRASFEDTQFLTIEFVLDNGKSLVVVLIFQVCGALPTMVSEKKSLSEITDTERTLHESAKAGHIIYQERFKNPYQRRLCVWFWVSPESSCRLVTHLKVPHYYPVGCYRLGQNFSFFTSTSVWEMRELEVSHEKECQEQNWIEKKTIRSGEWMSFVLEEDEAVVLSWRVCPVLGTPHCFVPPPRIETVTWIRLESLNVSPSSIPRLIEVNSNWIEWSLVGGEWNGVLKRELRLLHLGGVPEETDFSHPFRLIEKDEQKFDLRFGETEGERRLYPASGVFPG